MTDTSKPPISLNEHRALKENDATKWSPLECLKALVRDLESGACAPVDAVYVAMMRRGPTGQATTFPFYTAGARTIELRGMLAQHNHDICDAFNQSRS